MVAFLELIQQTAERPWWMPQPVLAEVNLLWLVLSLALGAASSLLLKKKQEKTVLLDDRPQTTATRGTHLPIALGINRVGAIVAWVGRRDSKDDNWYEDAIHLIALGVEETEFRNSLRPQQVLRTIYQDGVAIFDGRITPGTHSNGAQVTCRNGDIFKIYWGTEDHSGVDKGVMGEVYSGTTAQGAADVTWPYVMRIHWVQKKLGPVSIWPQIDYDVEIRPLKRNLTQTEPWHEETFSPGQFIVVLTNRNWSVLEKRISLWQCWVKGKKVEECTDSYKDSKLGGRIDIFPGSKITIQGATSGNGSYTVAQVQFRNNVKWFHATLGKWLVYENTTWVSESINGLVHHDNARVAISEGNDDAGANAAHLIDQLMFAKWPFGLGMDKSAFDMSSLEDLGVKLGFGALGEKLGCHALLANGAEFSEILGLIFQDLGVMLSLDPIGMKHKFVLIREPDGALPHLEEPLILPPRPEIETVHEDPEKSDHVVFTYRDQNKRHRDATIIVDEDGRAREFESKKARKIPLHVCRDIKSAGTIAARRQQEDFAGGVGYRIPACRAARFLMCGRAFTAFDIPDVMRVMEVHPSTLSSKVVIQAVKDHYGIPASQQSFLSGGKGDPPADPVQDAVVGTYEAPGFITLNRIALWVPRIRAPKRSVGASIRVFIVHPTQPVPSAIDPANFEEVSQVKGFETGGTLDANIVDADPWNDAQSVTITLTGTDADVVKDLSADEQRWRQGLQMVLINDEIMFLQSITAMGGGQYRMDGLLRGRLGTDKTSHLSGDQVYIFPNTIKLIEHDLLAVGATAHVITVPTADEALGFSPETDIEYLTSPLKGRGIAPLNPENLRTVNLRATYAANMDLKLKWSYRVRTGHKARTGAGMQGAGTATETAPPEGKFVLEIWKVSPAALVRTVEITGARTYDYPIDLLQQDFGGEPLQIDFKLWAELNGLKSEKTLTLRVDKSDDVETPVQKVTPSYDKDQLHVHHDFVVNSSDWDFNSNTGIPSYTRFNASEGHPGAIELLSGSTSGDWASMLGNSKAIVLGQHMVFEALIQSNVFGNPEAEVLRVGFFDDPNSITDAVYFETASAADGFWSIICETAGGKTEVVTGVNSSVANTWFELRIEFLHTFTKGAPTTSVRTARFYIGDLHVGDITTDVPNNTKIMAMGVYAKRGVSQEFKVRVDSIALVSDSYFQRL